MNTVEYNLVHVKFDKSGFAACLFGADLIQFFSMERTASMPDQTLRPQAQQATGRLGPTGVVVPTVPQRRSQHP